MKRKHQEEEKQKPKSVNYNEKNKNECIGFIIPSIDFLKQLVYACEEKWHVKIRVNVLGDPIEEDENEWVRNLCTTKDPTSQMIGVLKKQNYWEDKKHPTANDYLKKLILDGPVDGKGNKDTFIQVFILDDIRLIDEDNLSEWEKCVIHYAKQNNPKVFFYYWYRRMHFKTKEEETAYINEEEEYLQRKKQIEQDEKDMLEYIEMAHLLKELQLKSGPPPKQLVDDLEKIQQENEKLIKKKVEQ